MARRHNEYSRLLRTVENNPQPLKEQAGDMPMSNVPDVRSIADGCQSMARQLNKHAHNLHAIADMQPNFDEEVGEPPDLESMQFEGATGLPGSYF